MTSNAANDGSRRQQSVDGDWTSLDPARQKALLRGARPVDGEEAVIALGYSRRLMGGAWVMGVVAGLVGAAVSLLLSWLFDGSLQQEAWILACAIGVGLGLGVGLFRRFHGARLQRNAKEALGI